MRSNTSSATSANRSPPRTISSVMPMKLWMTGGIDSPGSTRWTTVVDLAVSNLDDADLDDAIERRIGAGSFEVDEYEGRGEQVSRWWKSVAVVRRLTFPYCKT